MCRHKTDSGNRETSVWKDNSREVWNSVVWLGAVTGAGADETFGVRASGCVQKTVEKSGWGGTMRGKKRAHKNSDRV